MNKKNKAMGEIRETLTLYKKQLMKWFYAAGGEEYLAIEKPLDTDKHKRLRLQWICKHHKKLMKYGVSVCHGDEKWFYTTNRRRKIKKLYLLKKKNLLGASFWRESQRQNLLQKIVITNDFVTIET